MAKIKALVEAVKEAVAYKSIRDFGYAVAGKTDAVRADGAWALDNIKNFLNEPAKEDLSELKEGFRLRFAANNPDVEYAVIDGNYIPKSELAADVKVLETIKIGVAYSFSFTQQEFGRLKADDLRKYQLIQDWRDKTNKYTSGCLGDLKAAARKVEKQRNPDSNSRAATLAFCDFIDKSFDAWKTRCKAAESRGTDPSADSDALNAAIIAFKVKYELSNKQ